MELTSRQKKVIYGAVSAAVFAIAGAFVDLPEKQAKEAARVAVDSVKVASNTKDLRALELKLDAYQEESRKAHKELSQDFKKEMTAFERRLFEMFRMWREESRSRR